MERAHKADEWGDAGHRGKQKMVGAAGGGVEGETPFGDLAQSELVAHLVWVQPRGHVTLWDQLDKEFKKFLMRSGDDRIRPFVMFLGSHYAQRCILTWQKTILPARIDPD